MPLMPQYAIDHAAIDYILGIDEMADFINGL